MRLIDADALKRKAQKVGTEAWLMKMTASIETTLNQFIDWIDDAPTIEAVSVVHGEWINHFDDLFPEDSTIECSICHEHQPMGIDENFCPNCGAKMDGERKESE